MEDSHHVNKDGSVHKTEKQRALLAAKGFNTNLVHFLPPYHVIINNLHVCSLTGRISHMHGRAPKTVLRVRNLAYKKNIIYEGLS